MCDSNTDKEDDASSSACWLQVAVELHLHLRDLVIENPPWHFQSRDTAHIVVLRQEYLSRCGLHSSCLRRRGVTQYKIMHTDGPPTVGLISKLCFCDEKTSEQWSCKRRDTVCVRQHLLLQKCLSRRNERTDQGQSMDPSCLCSDLQLTEDK